ncbi:MAG: type II secretion system F family protein, partial [Verrucomicrobiales bacterium]|nr:type II secretion system F family protein [Verrucomicrobiales bacterium]
PGLGIQCALLVGLWLAALLYLIGPRAREIAARWWPGLVDGLLLRLPWRRKRLQRDFSAMLAVLLDSGVPEVEAVTLAAETTRNAVFVRRAGRVREQLAGGVPLPEALQALDDSGELRWRVENARHGRSGFRAALAGWHEALDAKAFQLEQAAAHLATTALVLFNGALIGTLTVATFLVLIGIIGEAVLW